MALNYVTITETFKDGSGAALSNVVVTFTPSLAVYSASTLVATPAAPIIGKVVNGALKAPDGSSALQLLATDNAGLTYEGMTGFFYWTVTVNVGGIAQTWSFFLPSSPATVDLYATASTPALGKIFLPLAGGTMTGWLAPAEVPLTFGASIAVNAALGNVFAVTLTASTGTLANPTNPVDGQAIRVRVIQDATGGRTLAYGTAYSFGTAGAPVLSTGANKVDILGFEYVASLAKWCYIGSGLGF